MTDCTASLPAKQHREFLYAPADFERVRRLIRARAGICLSDQKQEMVYSRLSRRLRTLGLRSFGAYLDALESGGREEWEEFVNALTTNLTAFFREPHHFEILARRLRSWAATRPVRIWCAAASTGEEPYSIAMTLVETFSTWMPPASIWATDLDTSVLRKAELGVYPLERVESLGTERVRRFFLRSSGLPAGFAEVRPQLRSLVEFRRHNLLDPVWPSQAPFDAIFCRNVLIYFDKPSQRKVIEGLCSLLRPDGLLFVGHSEGLYQCADLVRLLGKTVYERLRSVDVRRERRAS